MIKKYKVLLPIGYSGRQEKGTVLDMDEEDAKAIGSDYLLEVSGSVEDTEEDADGSGGDKTVEEMSLSELKEKAAELQLPVSGSKADLIERINLALA